MPGFETLPLGLKPENAESFMISMRDGIRLSTDVYLPSERRPKPLPTILTREPYDKTSGYTLMPQIAEMYNSHGYVFVAQDVRGRARSEGETFPWVREYADGYDTIEWIVSQRWSNGAVAMSGDSYYGFTQWAAAATRHPALKAIAPRVTSATHLATLSPDGAITGLARVPWFILTSLDSDSHRSTFDWSIRPIRDAFTEASAGRSCLAFEALLAHPLSDSWWMRSIYGRFSPYDVVDIPILHWGGWWDAAKYGQFRDWRIMRSRKKVAGMQYLMADAMDHGGYTWLPGSREPASSDDWHVAECVAQLEMGLPFYDRYLRGAEERLPRVMWNLSGEGWQESDSWPPPTARSLVLYLCEGDTALSTIEGGKLLTHPEPYSRPVTWLHEPHNLVPDSIADTWHPLADGLPDERVVEDRDDVLTFTSEPLASPLRIAGPVALSVICHSTFRTLHLFGKLNDVFPDGRTVRIVLGGGEVHQPDFDCPVEIELGDVGYLLPCGHSLRLEIASSCFPRFLWHPGTDENPWHCIQGRSQSYTILCGAESGAALRLWVLN